MRKLFLFATLIATTVVVPQTQSVPRQDGASETWQKLLKLRTTASVMHVTAHPDDEHGGVLAKSDRIAAGEAFGAVAVAYTAVFTTGGAHQHGDQA